MATNYGFAASTIPNKYLATILDPFSYPDITIPDNNLTPAIAKMLTIGTTVRADGRSGAVIFMPNCPGRQLLTCSGTTTGKYILTGYIDPDQILADSYSQFRPVSSGLSIKSATLSAGDFAVNGSFNAIGLGQLPPLHTLTFDTLGSYRQDDTAVLIQQPIQDGVTITTPPAENHEYERFEWYQDKSMSDAQNWSFKGATGGWNVENPIPMINSGGRYMWTICSTPEFPCVQFGYNKVSVQCTLDILAPSGLPATSEATIELIAYYRGVTAGGVEIMEPVSVAVTSFTLASSAVHQFLPVALEGDVGTLTTGVNMWGRQLHSFSLQLTTTTALNNVEVFVRSIGSALLRSVNYTMNRRGVQGPSFIIAWNGVDAGNQLTISGVLNYEVIPTYQLFKDLKTKVNVPDDPHAMYRTELIMAQRGEYGIRTVWSAPQYEFFRSSVNSIVDQDMEAQRMGHAASGKKFSMFMKGLFEKIAPVAGTMLGGALGSVMGNPTMGARIGGNLGNAYQRLSMGANRNYSTGYAASSEITMETLLAKMEAMQSELTALKVENEKLKGVGPIVRTPISRQVRSFPMNRMTYVGGASVTYMKDDTLNARYNDYMNAVDNWESEWFNVSYFPYVYEGKGHVAMLIASRKPLAVLDQNNQPYDVDYMPLLNGAIFCDERLTTGPQITETITKYLSDSPYSYLSYVPHDRTVAIDGFSHVAAIWLACNGVPNFVAVTGDCYWNTEARSLEDKISACKDLGINLIVYGQTSDDWRRVTMTNISYTNDVHQLAILALRKTPHRQETIRAQRQAIQGVAAQQVAAPKATVAVTKADPHTKFSVKAGSFVYDVWLDELINNKAFADKATETGVMGSIMEGFGSLELARMSKVARTAAAVLPRLREGSKPKTEGLGFKLVSGMEAQRSRTKMPQAWERSLETEAPSSMGEGEAPL